LIARPEVCAPVSRPINVRRCGVGERVVPQPYTREMFEKTQAWMHARDRFDVAPDAGISFEQAVHR